MSFNPYGDRNKEELETPDWLFADLDAEFAFNLDPCASDLNHKCDIYFTKAEDGLKQDWGGRRAFVNPPYGRNIEKWVAKALLEALRGTTVVLLLPSRTGTRWWHDLIWDREKKCPRPWAEVRFLKGRLTFKGEPAPAKFDSVVVVFRKWP